MCIAADAKSIVAKDKTESARDVSVIKQGRRQPKSYGGGTSAQGHKDCKFCGNNHPSQKKMCPGWGKVCGRCSKKKHFSKKCFSSDNGSLHRV